MDNLEAGTEPVDPGEPVVTSEPAVPSWKESLDESLRNEPCLQSVKDIGALAKNYVNAQKAIGKKGVILPSKLDDKEGWDGVWNQLGRPEEPSKYSKPELKVPDEYSSFYTEEKIGNFAKIAHDAGLTDAQYKTLVEKYVDNEITGIKEIVDRENSVKNQAEASLKKDWGLDYEKQVNLANKTFDTFVKDMPEERAELYKNDPYIRRIMADVGQRISEDLITVSNAKAPMNAANVRAEINSLMGEKNSSFWNQSAPDHMQTKQKVQDLYAALAELEGE
jgi:hypothetical protein